MAVATLRVANMLTMVLHQGLKLVAAGIQNTCKIQRNVGGVVGMGLLELIRPIVKQLPLVCAFFGNLDRIFVHGRKSEGIQNEHGLCPPVTMTDDLHQRLTRIVEIFLRLPCHPLHQTIQYRATLGHGLIVVDKADDDPRAVALVLHKPCNTHRVAQGASFYAGAALRHGTF